MLVEIVTDDWMVLDENCRNKTPAGNSYCYKGSTYVSIIRINGNRFMIGLI